MGKPYNYNGVLIGQGAAAEPVSTAAGTANQALVVDTNGRPGFGSVSLTAGVTGTLPVENGGTEATTFTSNGVLYGNGTGAIQATTQGAANSVLTANAGAPSFSATPTVTSLSATTVDVTGNTGVRLQPFGTNAGETSRLQFFELAANGSNVVAFKSPDSIASSVTYVLPSADGGTAGDVLCTSAAGVLNFRTITQGTGITVTVAASTITIALSSTPLTHAGIMHFTTNSVTLANSGTEYIGHHLSATETDVEMSAPFSGTLANMHVRISIDPTSGAGVQSRAFTLRKNGVDTALTVTISEGSVAAADTTHTVSVTQGDRLSIKEVATNTPAPSAAWAGVEIYSTT